MKLKRKNKYAIGQVIGAGIQLGDMIGKPIRAKSEQIDPNTGQLINENAAINASTAGAFFDPLRTGMSTMREGSREEKQEYWKGFGKSLLGVPFLAGKGFGKARAKRLEEEAWAANNPNYYNSPENPYYMAQGGVAGEYAELEDGEPFMTPDGNIEMVNGRTHAQGGEDYILPEGTAILGKNESKVFGEKFKVLGEKLKRAQDKHQKLLDSNANPIARRSSMLMLDRIEKEYKELVNEQEMAKLGAANKQFARGGIYIKPENRGKFNATKKRTGKTTEELTYSSNPVTKKRAIFAQNAAKWKHPDGDIIRMQELLDQNYQAPTLNVPDVNAPNIGGFNNAMSALDTQKGLIRRNQFSNTLGTIGQLAPIIYNFGEGMFGKSEKYNYQQHMNPFIGDIRSAMRNRRYNAEPEFEANRLAQSVFNRNIRQGGLGPSQLIGGTQAGAVSRMRADAGVRAQQQNMNNDYLAQQAQMDYNLGENISRLKNYGYEMNLKNRAAKKNYLSTGLTQLQQYAQVQQLMKNQKLSDKEKLNLLKDIIPNYFYTPGLGYEQKN